MIAYIDASVVMRLILLEPNPLREWNALHHGMSSELIRVECHRTLDRLRHANALDERDVTAKRAEVEEILSRFDLEPLSRSVLKVAAQPLPTSIAALDALHLATAKICRDAQPENERPVMIATHDRALARAARAMNFAVLGA